MATPANRLDLFARAPEGDAVPGPFALNVSVLSRGVAAAIITQQTNTHVPAMTR
jgi:hypothetical protein